MTEFEYPGLADKIADALSFQRHAKVPPSRVALNASELSYIHSCISFYVSEQMLRRVEKLPLAGLPAIPKVGGWAILGNADTLPCETEQQP